MRFVFLQAQVRGNGAGGEVAKKRANPAFSRRSRSWTT
jgi:hypothetical protein